MSDHKQYESVYVVDMVKWRGFIKVYDFFKSYAYKHYGTISNISEPPESLDAVFTLEVETVDFYNDILHDFIDVIDYIDKITVEGAGEDLIKLTVCTKNMWEEAGPHE